MKLQRYEEKSQKIREAFLKLKQEHPERLKRRLDLSFCSQCFGIEDLTESIARLADCGYSYIEVPGNYGGPDSGHHIHLEEILKAMNQYDMKCSGVCPTDFESLAFTTFDYIMKQDVKNHIRGNVAFCKALGGSYYLITAGPCGVPAPGNAGDWERSVKLVREVADCFTENGIKCVIEPVLKAFMPICNNVEEAKQYIRDVDHPGLQHIYGDLQHFLAEEDHIGEAILNCGGQMLCIHIRDTNNGLHIGNGMMDLDTVIRALYLIGFNTEGHFVVGEPNPSAYMQNVPFFSIGIPYPEEAKRRMAAEALEYFREREEEVLAE